jgi:DNA-binding response OmpR family regulator
MAKILLVDDDVDQNLMVATYLADNNHVVDVATTAAEGKHLLSISEYDVVILDRALPDGEGAEICRWYRAKGTAPVLMLTGKDKISEREEGLDAGADDYLIKPFDVRELSARIRALLRRPTSFVGLSLTIGEYVLDPAGLTVEKAGKQWRLRPREFALLEFLARHPDEIFHGNALMVRVWSAESESTTDTLRTAIKHIRQQLEDDKIIEYIAGAGYRAGYYQKRPAS